MTTGVLRRPRHGGVIGGVCAAFANWTGIDAFWFRLAFIILALPGGAPGVVPYLILWLIIPKERR